MITNSGKAMFGEALASLVGGHIAVGVGAAAPTAGSTALGFEVMRVPIRSSEYDAVNNRVVYSGTIPEHMSMKISEVGLLTSSSASPSNGMITSFDPSLEEWTAGTWDTNNVRIGNEGLRLAGASAYSAGAVRSALSNVRSADVLQVAYHGAGGNVEVRLNSTEADYHSFTFPAGTGYSVKSVRIKDLQATGDANIPSVSGVTVIHSGSGNVTMDAIRVHTIDDEEALAVHQRFSQLYTKIEGMPLDIDIPVVIQL